MNVLKKLNKAYAKKLNKMQTPYNTMHFFVTYLCYVRDYFILTEPLIIDDKDNFKIATITTAINEYNLSRTCVFKYYDAPGKVSKKLNKPEEEIKKAYEFEKNFHWNNFIELVKENSKDWRIDNVKF